jgi:hypothetical protein
MSGRVSAAFCHICCMLLLQYDQKGPTVFTALAYVVHAAITHTSTHAAGNTGSTGATSIHGPAQHQNQEAKGEKQAAQKVAGKQTGKLGKSVGDDEAAAEGMMQAQSTDMATQAAPAPAGSVQAGSDHLSSQQGTIRPDDSLTATLTPGCVTHTQQPLPRGPVEHR